MRRDAAEYDTRGVSSAVIDAFEVLGNQFEMFPSYEMFKADVGIAVEVKNAIYENLIIAIRNITDYAAIKWGNQSPQYKRFGVKDINNLGDTEMIYTSRRVIQVAEGFLADLIIEGLTQQIIDDLVAIAQSFEDNMNVVKDAVADRDKKTEEMIQHSNQLYSYVSKYCEIGKVIWKYTSEAYYPGKFMNIYLDYHYSFNFSHPIIPFGNI